MAPLVPVLLTTLTTAAALRSLSRSNPERRLAWLTWGAGRRGEQRSFWFYCLVGLAGGLAGLSGGELVDADLGPVAAWLLSLVGPLVVIIVGLAVHNRAFRQRQSVSS